MLNRHCRLLDSLIEAIRACAPTARVGTLRAIGFASVLLAGCAELEPMPEPEVVDLQLTTDTLKSSVRDAQRTVAELRTELETRRIDLAEALVARAQLEGRVREAERRLTESRQVIELQREELAAARTERERASRSSLQSQSQKKQLHKPLSRMGGPGRASDGDEAVPLPSSGATRKGQRAMQIPAQRILPSEFLETPQPLVIPDAVMPMPVNLEPSSGGERLPFPANSVSVKRGDTLWRIAQTYRLSVENLRQFNQLIDNKIIIGEVLWLPDDRPMSEVGPDKVESIP